MNKPKQSASYVPLSEITTKIGSGATPRGGKKSYKSSGISLIRSLNVHDGAFKEVDLAFIDERQAEKLKNVKVRKNDVLLNITGASVARCCIVPEHVLPARVNQHVSIIRLDPAKAEPRYLGKVLTSQSFKQGLLNLAMSGATREALTKSDIERFTVPLPALEVQQKIAAILTAYDDLIENNRQRIALLEKMAKEIYREWFVRMRFPGHEHTPVHKGVPEGWEPTSLFELCRLKRGYDLPKQNVVEGKYPILAATGIAGFHNEYKAEAPVVTTGRSGSLGTVVWSSQPAWPLNTSLYLADSKGNSKHFLFFTLKSANLAQFNSGAGVPTLNRNHLSCVRVLRPSEDIQAQFDQVIARIREQSDILQRTVDLLDETRDLLLNRLISGKLRVDDLEIQFPPSMQAEAA